MKILLRTADDYEELKSPYSKWFIGNPEKYPCICIYERNEGATNDFYTGEFIYLDDFQDCVPNGNADGVGI